MSFNVGKGQALVLRLTLPENDSTKFVRAFVRDENGVQLAGSPFTLNNLGDGRYIYKDENALVFPNSAIEVNAIYQTFDDSGFTTPTVDYQFQVEDVFRVSSDASSIIDDQITELGEMVQKALHLEPGIEAEIEQEDESIEAELGETNQIEAEIDDN